MKNFRTFVFDCDGVVLNSNKVKTNAFYKAALPYGENYAQALVDYHVAHGGISRYKKFEYFLTNIVGKEVIKQELQSLLDAYAFEVKTGLLNCDITPGLQELRQNFPESRWLIVSGGDQAELRDIFKQRDLFHLFDGGIFGSPDSKDDILEREIKSNNILFPAVFLGDSRYDYEAAERAGLDFLFISEWTEFKGWNEYFADKDVITLDRVGEFLKLSKH